MSRAQQLGCIWIGLRLLITYSSGRLMIFGSSACLRSGETVTCIGTDYSCIRYQELATTLKGREN
jgi:hypothetical protein